MWSYGLISSISSAAYVTLIGARALRAVLFLSVCAPSNGFLRLVVLARSLDGPSANCDIPRPNVIYSRKASFVLSKARHGHDFGLMPAAEASRELFVFLTACE